MSSKHRWTPEEDEALKHLVQAQLARCPLNGQDDDLPHQTWREIAHSLASVTDAVRNVKQCRERWRNQLDPNLTDMQWTDADEELLRQLRLELGNAWRKIAARMPGRSENQVKNHFYSAQRKLERQKSGVRSRGKLSGGGGSTRASSGGAGNGRGRSQYARQRSSDTEDDEDGDEDDDGDRSSTGAAGTDITAAGGAEVAAAAAALLLQRPQRRRAPLPDTMSAISGGDANGADWPLGSLLRAGSVASGQDDHLPYGAPHNQQRAHGADHVLPMHAAPSPLDTAPAGAWQPMIPAALPNGGLPAAINIPVYHGHYTSPPGHSGAAAAPPPHSHPMLRPTFSMNSTAAAPPRGALLQSFSISSAMSGAFPHPGAYALNSPLPQQQQQQPALLRAGSLTPSAMHVFQSSSGRSGGGSGHAAPYFNFAAIPMSSPPANLNQHSNPALPTSGTDPSRRRARGSTFDSEIQPLPSSMPAATAPNSGPGIAAASSLPMQAVASGTEAVRKRVRLDTSAHSPMVSATVTGAGHGVLGTDATSGTTERLVSAHSFSDVGLESPDAHATSGRAVASPVSRSGDTDPQLGDDGGGGATYQLPQQSSAPIAPAVTKGVMKLGHNNATGRAHPTSLLRASDSLALEFYPESAAALDGGVGSSDVLTSPLPPDRVSASAISLGASPSMVGVEFNSGGGRGGLDALPRDTRPATFPSRDDMPPSSPSLSPVPSTAMLVGTVVPSAAPAPPDGREGKLAATIDQSPVESQTATAQELAAQLQQREPSSQPQQRSGRSFALRVVTGGELPSLATAAPTFLSAAPKSLGDADSAASSSPADTEGLGDDLKAARACAEEYFSATQRGDVATMARCEAEWANISAAASAAQSSAGAGGASSASAAAAPGEPTAPNSLLFNGAPFNSPFLGAFGNSTTASIFRASPPTPVLPIGSEAKQMGTPVAAASSAVGSRDVHLSPELLAGPTAVAVGPASTTSSKTVSCSATSVGRRSLDALQIQVDLPETQGGATAGMPPPASKNLASPSSFNADAYNAQHSLARQSVAAAELLSTGRVAGGGHDGGQAGGPRVPAFSFPLAELRRVSTAGGSIVAMAPAAADAHAMLLSLVSGRDASSGGFFGGDAGALSMRATANGPGSGRWVATGGTSGSARRDAAQ